MQIDLDQKLILYFIKNVGFPKINTTLIFKLLFLIDFEHCSIFSKKLTSHDYKKHYHGPFSQTIYNDIDYLESLNLIFCNEEDKISIFGQSYKECSYKLLGEVEIKLTHEEKTLADTMVELGKRYTLKEIKETPAYS